MTIHRRLMLQAIASLATAAVLPARAAAALPCFAAAWALPDRQQVGLLAPQGDGLRVAAAQDVPMRAHGLLAEPGGVLLCVARRPGDWLLRWRPATGQAQWAWIEPDRAYNGHVIASADGRHLYTTETNLETGEGLIGMRDAASLEKVAEWPTGGMDPHELLLDADGTLLLANGGIPTLPETGRLKIGLERMDSSLVRLHTAHGNVLGQWRLDDQRLSLRHIAWGPSGAAGRVLGIALQAEHDRQDARQNAPLLALFDGRTLCSVPAPQPLAGYGGDIAFAGGRFAVSCPRAQGVALYGADGRWQGLVPLAEACALATRPDQPGDPSGAMIWAGGLLATQAVAGGRRLAVPDELRLDNHWLLWPATP